MSTNLLIVESPAKSKTLKKYLGKNFDILASYGHVRDLVPKEGAVDPEHDFAMKYEVIDRNAKHVLAIQKALKKADALYLATDPDREGEAISWHLLEILKSAGALEDKHVHRVVFNEITKSAVQAAIQNPRQIADDLVNAQQARRALDYLVGFNLSPLLWKKIRRGLSAGRVQSPALRLIVERQEEIDRFVSQEYWSLWAKAQAQEQPFSAKLIEYQQEKLKQFSITQNGFANTLRQALLTQAKGKLLVKTVKKSQRKRNPSAPFITSTLQQEAARKLGFSAKRTMVVAQQLYEGVEIGEGAQGLITYMRTDSVALANEALGDIRALIEEKYGASDLPEQPVVYKTKAKNAQEAHEAIRPTSVRIEPSKVKGSLTPDQYKLYNLIWQRTMACQMIHATYDAVGVDLECGTDGLFRATGSTLVNPGFLKVYEEGVDDAKGEDANIDKLLPPLREGEFIDLNDIVCEQHFTEPPPKFTEASLIKALEDYGIGRPSTYASIISTLQNREYVTLEKKRFEPTDVGRIVNKFLTTYFTQYVDYDFTAKLEDSLDAISRGESEWVPVLQEFWKPFIGLIQRTEKEVQRSDVTQEAIDETCPKCNKLLSIRLGKRGRFIGCTGYPECDYTRNVHEAREESLQPQVVEGRVCPTCQSELVYKRGPYGKFIGCRSYPQCKFIEPLDKPEDTGVMCPACKVGKINKKKSRYGKFFYACNAYPKCKYAIPNEPLDEACPDCGWPILMIKTAVQRADKVCPQKGCGFRSLKETE